MFVIITTVLVLFMILLAISTYQKATNAVCVSKRRLDGKTAIVTGGTAGMGFEIAKDFAQRGARVIIVCPFQKEGLDAQKQIIEETEHQDVVFKLLDLGSFVSIRQFATDILKEESRLDILVNNAGIGSLTKLSKDGLSLVMQVNYFGAFLLTILLLPLLRKSGTLEDPSRIVNVSSYAHNYGVIDLKNLNYNDAILCHVPVYARSKLCLVLFSNELSRRVADWNVVVNSVDPGAVGTRIFYGWSFLLGIFVSNLFKILFKTPWQGAQTAIYASVDKKAGAITGAYFKNCEVSKAVKKASDKKLAKQLWDESVRLVKLSDTELDTIFFANIMNS